MSSWLATGAGTEECNGIYTEAGTYVGHPYYQNQNGILLFFIGGHPGWGIGVNLGGFDAYYFGYIYLPLPDNPWFVNTGDDPPPVLSEITGNTIKKINGVARAGIATINGVLLSNIKKINGVQ